MPLEPRSEPDSSLLSEFATGCHLPETIQIVIGYESLESEELSWSSGEIVNLHSLREATWAIARDENGNEFSIPLAYPRKIFERIPKGCREVYETVEELIAAQFPKYVRSLRDIPNSGISVGDILELVEASENDGGSKQLRCRMVGKSCTTVLSWNQSGPFQALENVNPGRSLREVVDGHSLPVCVRAQSGKTKAFDGSNRNPLVKFEGLLFLEQTVQQKVFIVSTLHGKQLRVLKIPIDLEITVRRVQESKLDPNLLSRICHLIETVIDIDSAITCGSTGDVSWYFEIQTDPASYQNENLYEEIRPQVPPRSPVKPGCEPDLKQNKINSVDTRYGTLTPKEQPLKNPSVPVKPSWREMKPLPPLVAKKPNAAKPKQLKKGPPPSSCQPPTQKGGSELKSKAALQSDLELGIPADADPQDYCRLRDVMPKDEGMVQRADGVTPVKEIVQKGGNDEALKDSHDESKLYSSENTVQGQQTTCSESLRKHLEGISVSEVSEWLRKLGLNQYVDNFAKESIDGTMLLELDDETMQCIGITNPLHRKKLLMFIQRGWTPKR